VVRGGAKVLRSGAGNHKIGWPISLPWCTFINCVVREHELANLKEVYRINRYALIPNRQGTI
jgi:hypothetical protein